MIETAKTGTAVAVVGGGRMGVGIAHAFAAVGASVTVVEPDASSRAGVKGTLERSLQKTSERGGLTEPVDALLARIHIAAAVDSSLADSALVVEAVPELPELKAGVLRHIEEHVGADCLIASNTSSLSITELSRNLADPGRFFGMHFFNPVQASSLVEIVVGTATSREITTRAVDWVRRIGKTEIVVRDSPGFATSRLGVLLGLEAIRMLEEGVADAAAIDRAMELGYRHPTGPLRSTDLVGLDVRLHIADHLAATLGPRFEPPQLLRDKVARGELGRKSGQGFYAWP